MTITPELREKKFPSAPVKEVAFEIRFSPLLKVQRDVADFQERIVRDYPTYSRERIPLNGEQVDAWRFTSEDGTRTIRLSEKSFGFITNKYSTFEDYKAELLTRLETFREVFSVKVVKRIGLRYINNIALGGESTRDLLLRYVNPTIDVQRIGIEELTRFACEVRLRKTAGTLNVRTGLIDMPPELAIGASGRSVYILDLDFYEEGDLEFPSSELLERFHDEIQTEFLGHLQREYIGVMEKHREGV